MNFDTQDEAYRALELPPVSIHKRKKKAILIQGSLHRHTHKQQYLVRYKYYVLLAAVVYLTHVFMWCISYHKKKYRLHHSDSQK